MDDVALHHEEEEEAGGGKGDGLARQAPPLASNDGHGEDVQEGDAQEDPRRELQHEVEGGVGDLGAEVGEEKDREGQQARDGPLHHDEAEGRRLGYGFRRIR